MGHNDRSPAVGDLVADRYVVQEVLGRGGMGTVYRVSDARGQQRALKRARAGSRRKAPRRAALLEREYHTLAQLAHPRIIEVFEYGVDAQGPYYTMELLDGSDLDKRGRLAWQEACALLYDVASSLAILHARGLIHRDLSLRNVRCTREGRAKLIDFGAMAAMGVAKEVVGTPPFVAPEALQMQELDARADLFSLGAIAYFMLTGRNAYPARNLRELRDVWRSRPAAPARLVPELPAALSGLVMELLMLDRSARPRSAAEVMERLQALGDLPRDESIEVSRAYLTTPALVGREKALVGVRRQILSLVRRDGGTLLIEGVAGSGRSRMLSACVLEGKLLGATVVRAAASDGNREDWAVARALCSQLWDALPNEAAEAARVTKDVLVHVIDALAREGSVSAFAPERRVLLRALRDFVLSLARGQRLLLVVDDVDEIDEPSAAWLAALAHKTERNGLLLTLSVDSEPRHASASLRLLRLVAQRIELEQLTAEQTLTLVGSLFGDVPNLQLLAAKIYTLAQGNPRATMDLAQHLRERGLARYEAGSWLLPATIADGDLPKTLSDALAGRLAGLSSDARSLLEVMCLADGDALSLKSYVELTRFDNHARAYAAIHELEAARILKAEGDHYSFSQRGLLPVLHEHMSPERRRAIHSQLAQFLARTAGNVLRRAEHLMCAGEARELTQLLCSLDLQVLLPPVALLEYAIEQAEQLRVESRTIHQLRMALLSKASVVLSADSFRRCLPKVLAQLERDSGLSAYRELAALPDAERLKQALALTQARYEAAPEAERVYPLVDAIRELARLSGATCSFATQLFELDTLESLPSLEPLIPLSSALSVIAAVVEASKQLIAGRALRHREIADRVQARIALPDRAGLDEMQHKRTQLGLHYAVGLFEAVWGISQVEDRTKLLEAAREYRVNGWRLRMLLHQSQGDADEARKCERRAELLHLQENADQRYVQMGSSSEIQSLAESSDILAVKNTVENLTALAAIYPGWRPYLAYGQCRYRWLQGDLQGALDVLLPAFELALPTRHNAFPCLAAARVRLLAELGRSDEAVRFGEAYRELCEREQLICLDHGISIGLAKALCDLGRHAAAVSAIEAAIDRSERLGSEGLALGVLYETRARVAIDMGDQSAFKRFAERCAHEYKKARNLGLTARFSRMIEDARQRHIEGNAAAADILSSVDSSASDSSPNSVHSRIVECLDQSDRARCALTLLLQSTESACGYLYGVRDAKPVLLAALPEVPPDDQLTSWVLECLQAELARGSGSTGETADDPTHSEVARRFTDADGQVLEPIFLFAARQRPLRVAAVLALQVSAGARTLPPRALLDELAEELLEHGDVNGMYVEEAATTAD